MLFDNILSWVQRRELRHDLAAQEEEAAAAEARLLVTAAVSSALRSSEAEGHAPAQPKTAVPGPAGSSGAAADWTTASVALPLELQRLQEENAALCRRIAGLEEALAQGRSALGHSNSAQKIQYFQRVKDELEEVRREANALLKLKFTLEQCIRCVRRCK